MNNQLYVRFFVDDDVTLCSAEYEATIAGDVTIHEIKSQRAQSVIKELCKALARLHGHKSQWLEVKVLEATLL